MLFAPAGRAALDEAVRIIADGADPVAAASALRRSHSPELAAAALTQASLRRRAETKFGADAAVMFFTPHGLEQATRPEVAAHRAARISAAGLGAAGFEATGAGPTGVRPAGVPDGPTGGVRAAEGPRVLDVCCGIGGDLLALARAGCAVDALDLDPLTVEIARANAAALGLSSLVTVRTADAAAADPGEYDLLFADPARRGARGRTFDPMAYSPSWPVVLDLVARAPAACLKTAPGIPYEFIPEGAEAEWVSYRGEVKEAAIWTGMGTGGRRATLLPSGATLTASGAEADAGPVSRYLYEPDGAAVRAHLVAEVAALVSGHLVDPRIAYITGDRLVPTPWAACYEVTDVMPFSLKRLRAALRERRVGAVTIKKRGSAVDVERLRKDLRLSGSESVVIVLTRIEDRPFVLLCQPVTSQKG
ncbi:methyltransferase domain-containing protein [Microbispora cellulosiformans]|uniref:Methyltransferase domain-containing protein n=1 Tax=Microbispora cellulosiformans TaxID=2614688 RepID=A0A5J5KAQ2_9ACTN|nr:methyltransferase domain-containing protein [Microbispora cellulosiformans]KAA9382070.1 methyltransferase domain-containing protein [Microbispora cellulosiformans]